MLITQKQMDKVNQVQVMMLDVFREACDELGIKYFLIHGSLLGAVRYSGFFPLDDDIDIAMHRSDFEILLKNSLKVFKYPFFLQYCDTEEEYPLSFAKLRNSETAFIQPVLENCKINKGIYLDIFILDNYPSSQIKRKFMDLKRKILSYRVGSIMNGKHDTTRERFLNIVAKLIYPSWKKASFALSRLYANEKYSGWLVINGGKQKEKGMPYEWFNKTEISFFDSREISIPSDSESYLRLIYGDYLNYLPSDALKNNDKVSVSAEIIDCSKSYKNYERGKTEDGAFYE